MKRLFQILFTSLAWTLPVVAEDWTSALSHMPLPREVTSLSRSNCAEVVLGAFQSNATVKALIFMPGATDELYFFKRVKVQITNSQPTLLDAVVALTNQSPLRVAFRPPFLLLHSDEDVLELDARIKHPATVEKLKQTKLFPRLVVQDRDWDFLLTAFGQKLSVELRPAFRSPDSWHFYRHTFAAYDSTSWDILQAAAYAGKTRFTVQKDLVEFEPDPRIGVLPRLESFPR